MNYEWEIELLMTYLENCILVLLKLPNKVNKFSCLTVIDYAFQVNSALKKKIGGKKRRLRCFKSRHRECHQIHSPAVDNERTEKIHLIYILRDAASWLW